MKFIDPIEQRHKATNARIRAGAKAGKYWLLRSESENDMNLKETDREWLIRKIIETTTSGAIGGRSMSMGGDEDDPAFGGRNKFTKKQLRFAIQGLLSKGSSK